MSASETLQKMADLKAELQQAEDTVAARQKEVDDFIVSGGLKAAKSARSTIKRKMTKVVKQLRQDIFQIIRDSFAKHFPEVYDGTTFVNVSFYAKGRHLYWEKEMAAAYVKGEVIDINFNGFQVPHHLSQFPFKNQHYAYLYQQGDKIVAGERDNDSNRHTVERTTELAPDKVEAFKQDMADNLPAGFQLTKFSRY
jgi:hypothetical protein